MIPDEDPDAKRPPSSFARAFTQSRSSARSNVDTHAPVATFHTRTVLSRDAETTRRPCGETATLVRGFECPGSVATQCVTPGGGKSRGAIQREIKQKEAAIEYLARRYASARLPPEAQLFLNGNAGIG